jgi:peptidoglycan/xylan/chitin deacetylase (PgdA/CDA1 family)
MFQPRTFRNRLLFHVCTNLALLFLIASVGFVCLRPYKKDQAAQVYDQWICRRGNSANGVSLMFNVYWGADEVYRILDILQAYQAKATFFIGGSWADDNEKCVQEIAARGHEIGNHGYFHKDHSTMTESQNRAEIVSCSEFLRQVIGSPVLLFAPPSGAYNDATIKAALELGMKTVLWSRDTVDWRDKNSALIYTRATKNVKGGELILMHPMQETANALKDILTYYQLHGFCAITVSENVQTGG